MRTLRTLIVLLGLVGTGFPAQAADAPLFDPGNPPFSGPRVLGCDLAPSLAFAQCVLDEGFARGQAAGQAARAASEAALNQTISNLNSTVAGMQGQVGDLQAQVAALQAELAQAGQQAGQGTASRMQRLPGQAAAVVSGPFAALFDAVPQQALHTCMQNKGMDVGAVFNNATSDPVTFSRNLLASMWQRNMAAASAIVADPTRFGQVGGRTMNTAEIIDEAERMTGRIAAQDPIAQCLWSLSGPARSQVKIMAAQVAPAIKAQYDAAVDSYVKPAVNRAMVDTLKPLLTQVSQVTATATRGAVSGASRVAGGAARGVAQQAMLQIPEYARDIMFAVAHDYVLNSARMQRAKSEIDLLAGALRAGDDAAAQVQQRKVDQQLTELTTFSDEMAVEIAIETMRRYGHTLIDTDGQTAIDTAFAAIQAIKDVIMKVVTGIVSAFWEPASAIGEVVCGVITVIIDVHQPPAQFLVTAGSHAALDAAMDQARRAIRDGQAPSAYIRQAGPLGELLRHFPSENDLVLYASPELNRVKNDLFAYHAAVQNLSRSAVTTTPDRTTTSKSPLRTNTTRPPPKR